MSSRDHVTALESRLLMSTSVSPKDLLPSVTVSGIVFNDSVKKNGKPDAGEGVNDCIVTFNNNLDHTVATPTTAADGSYTATLEPGSYDVTVVGPTVTSNFENKNFIVSPFGGTLNIQVSTQPTSTGSTGGKKKVDLALSVKGVPATFAPTTKSTPITVTVSNPGDTYNGKAAVTIDVSKTKITNDVIISATPTLAIKKGSSKVVRNFDLTPIASLLPAGKYFVIAKLTVTGDTNSANNTITETFTVTKKKK
jgi:hypothetical protein